MLDSLVAFKGKPARIVGQTTHKFDLLFADDSTRKVREKDFRFIHPTFEQIVDTCPKADIEVLDEFQGEFLSLKEITEWLFDDYTAQNAWCASLLVEDGLYFYWQKDQVFVRPAEQVKSIEQKRQQEKAEAESLARCVQNIQNNTYDEQDLPYIQSIEKVALNQSKHAKILTVLKLDNTPESAHQLLLKIGYWQPSYNPYPKRYRIFEDEQLQVKATDIPRKDLSHFESYAIDNAGSNDADDAIGIDGDKIWIHIADVSTFVQPDSDLDIYAQKRISNLYLPEQVLHMLPLSLTQQCALGTDKLSNALSVGFSIEGGRIADIEICHAKVRVEKLSYDEVDSIIHTHGVLSKLKQIADHHRAYRDEKGAISLNLPNVNVKLFEGEVEIYEQSDSVSRQLVAEMMIICGRAVSSFAQENDIAMPYATQDEGDFPQEILDKKYSLTLSEAFKATKHFKRSKTTTKASVHYGMGLESYLRFTSPLRRYLDLLAHQQIANFITQQPILDEKSVAERIAIFHSMMPNIGKTNNYSQQHFKCLYLLSHSNWQDTGVVVDKRDDKATLLIPSLAMITQIRLKRDFDFDDKINLKVRAIDLVNLSVDFKPC